MAAGDLIQAGDTIKVTAPTGGYTAGEFVALASRMVGRVMETVTGSGTAVLLVDGVFEVATKKAGAGEAWAQGDDVFLTATGDFTETATGNTYAGTAWESAATGATTGYVKLNWGTVRV